MALFKPYKLTSSELSSLPIVEGQFIITTDENKIYLDVNNSERHELVDVESISNQEIDEMWAALIVALFTGYTNLQNTVELNDDNITIDENKSLFVAKTGNDSTGTGTSSAPYATISKALENVTAGQTIYVHAGTYNEFITFEKSGEINNPITIRNYPNEIAIIDGSNITNAETLIDFNGNSYINVIGLELCNLTQTTTSIYGILARGGEQNIIIANCNIHDINSTSATEGNANGIKIFGLNETTPCKNILIQNNSIHNCVCGWSESLTVSANSEYIDIIGNEIYNNSGIGIDIAGNFDDIANVSLDFARYIYVAENEVYNCTSQNAEAAGIYCDGASNVIFARNTSYNNQMGVEVGAEQVTDEGYLPHNILIINNLIYNNTYNQMRLGGYSEEVGRTYDIRVYNNTMINPSEAEGSTMVLTIGDGFAIANNIIVDKGSWHYLIDGDFDSTLTKNVTLYNNNLYHSNSEYMDNYFKIQGTEYHTTTLQAANFVQDNIFTEITLNNDYSLPANSPAIDCGYYTEEIFRYLDLSGKERTAPVDIGCFEFNS